MHPAQRVLSIRTHLKQHNGVLSSQGKSAHAKRNVKAQDQARAANVSRMHPGPKRKRSEEWARHLEKGGTNTTSARQPATTPMEMQEMSAACGAMRSEDRSGPMD